MKKLLSIALAVAMIMSIAVVALAADANTIPPAGITFDTSSVNLNLTTGKVTQVDGPFAMNTDDNYMKLLSRLGTQSYGGKIYYANPTPSRA